MNSIKGVRGGPHGPQESLDPSNQPELIAGRTGRAICWKTFETGGGRLIALLRTLILARLLLPEDFGLVAIGIVCVEFVISLTNFGMTEALIRRPESSEREDNAAWTFEAARAVVVAALMYVAAPMIATTFFGEPRAVPILRALSLAPVLDHVASIRVVHLTRSLRLRPLAIIHLSGASIHAIVAVALASKLGVWALVIGLLAGVLAQTVASYGVAPYRPRPCFDRHASAPLFRFGRWIFLTEMVRVLGLVLLQTIISRQLGVAQLGLYFLATRLAFLPRDLVQRVVGNVAFALHARLQADPERAVRTFQRTLTGISLLIAPAYLIGITLAPAAVRALTGPMWSGAAPVMQLLAVAALIGVLADVAVPALQGRGRADQAAALFVIRSMFIVGLVWTLSARFGITGAGFAWIAGETVGFALAAFFAARCLPHPFTGLFRGFVLIGALAAGGAVTAAALVQIVPGALGMGSGVALALAVAVTLVRALDGRFGIALGTDALFGWLRPAVLTRIPGQGG